MEEKYTKKELKEDLHKVKEKLGHSPSLNEYREHGNYSITAFTHQKWDNWNEAKKEAGLLTNYPAFKEIPKDEMLTELRRVWMETGDYLTNNDIREKSRFSPQTYKRKFGTLKQAKKEAEIEEKDKIQLWEIWVDKLNEENLWGRYRQEEIKKHLRSFHPGKFKEFLEWNKKQDNGLEISDPKTNSNRGQRQMFIKTNGRDFKEHLEHEYSDDIPEGYEDIFKHYISKGRSPDGILGTLQYLTEDITQKENDYCTAVTVRNMTSEMFEDGFRDRFPDEYKMQVGKKEVEREDLNVSTTVRDKLKALKKGRTYPQILESIVQKELEDQHCEECGRADKEVDLFETETNREDLFLCGDCVDEKIKKKCHSKKIETK